MNVQFFGVDSSGRIEYRITPPLNDPLLPGRAFRTVVQLSKLIESAPEMLEALEKAQPILDENLQSLCNSFCVPCEPGEKFDYTGLAEPELGWITKAEAALDAVEAAIKLAKEKQ